MNLRRVIALGLPLIAFIGLSSFWSINYTLAQPTGDDARPIEQKTEDAPKAEKPAATGVDPELVQVDEPDSIDLDPELAKVNDDNSTASTRPKLDDKSVDELKKALGNQKSTSSSNGGIMPRLVGVNIPTIPINLLFPHSNASVTKTTRVEQLPGNSVMMLGINRLTGTSLKFRIPVGSVVRFETINIGVTACYVSNPNEAHEAWAYVDVVDLGAAPIQQMAVLAQRNRAKLREAQEPHRLRKGWIIASSPTVTPIDHPNYDLSLLSCEGAAASSANIASTSATEVQGK
jgi:hypothetical protein